MQQANEHSSSGVMSGDFCDRRAFIVGPSDDRLAMLWDDYGGFEQVADGPVYVVIGEKTDDERCGKLAQRFGLNLNDLITFREAKRTEIL